MKRTLIMGAGPIGAAYAMLLSKTTHVTIFERRPFADCCKSFGRSVNLVLTRKAWSLFKAIGIEEEVKKIVVPMQGRMIHDRFKSEDVFISAYGVPGQTLDSVSRAELNRVMLEKLQTLNNVKIHYEIGFESGDFYNDKIILTNGAVLKTADYNLILAADGAGSLVRESMKGQGLMTAERSFLNYGYVEYEIPKNVSTDSFPTEFLHIYPLGKMMCIALPNPDGSFTGGVFAPVTGENSFATITETGAKKFFSQNFPRLMEIVPNFVEQYQNKQVSVLSEVRCSNWSYKNVIVVGDAAHAITPFLGQGMNFGLKMSQYFCHLLEQHSVFDAIQKYENFARPESALIAQWSLENFHEMCNTQDPMLRLKKTIERKLAETFPKSFACFHTMVSFCDLNYSQIEKELARQNKGFKEVLRLPNIEKCWDTVLWEQIVEIMVRKDVDFYHIQLPAKYEAAAA